MSQPCPAPFARSQRGLTLVEMMVGLAVGLFVLAGATLVVSSQLNDNRRLLLETQVQQDLRASADIITRELRRAGAHGNPVQLLQTPGGAAPVVNGYASVVVDDGEEISFNYRRNQQEGPYGFRVSSGVIQTFIGDGWQALTDDATMNVTGFTITALPEIVDQIPCAKACSADPLDTACWPTLAVRTYQVDIAAEARSDPQVRRSVRSFVRLRNDIVRFNDPLNPGLACPA
jgi:prepilin-type N-terminal cleavage/methylation domain-containing protein